MRPACLALNLDWETACNSWNLYAQVSDELQNLKAQSEAHLKEKIHSQVLEEKLDKLKRENQEKTAQLCKVKQQHSKCYASRWFHVY